MAGGRGWNIRDATRRFQFRVTRHASFPTASDLIIAFRKFVRTPLLYFVTCTLCAFLSSLKANVSLKHKRDIYLGGFACFLAHLREGYPGDYAQ